METEKKPWYNRFDLVGVPFGLRFNGDSKIKSRAGVLSSFLIFVIIGYYFYTRLVVFFKKELISVSTLKINMYSRDPLETFSLEKYKVLPMVEVEFFASEDFTKSTDSILRFITPVVGIETSTESLQIPYIPCTSRLNMGKLCPDYIKLERFPLLGSANEDSSNIDIALHIYPCSLSIGCVDESLLQERKITLSYDLRNVDVNNYNYPISDEGY